MKSILESMYDGEIFPKAGSKNSTLYGQAVRQEALFKYEQFAQKLTEAQRREFQEVIDSNLDAVAQEVKAAYINGIQLGIKLITESIYQE